MVPVDMGPPIPATRNIHLDAHFHQLLAGQKPCNDSNNNRTTTATTTTTMMRSGQQQQLSTPGVQPIIVDSPRALKHRYVSWRNDASPAMCRFLPCLSAQLRSGTALQVQAWSQQFRPGHTIITKQPMAHSSRLGANLTVST